MPFDNIREAAYKQVTTAQNTQLTNTSERLPIIHTRQPSPTSQAPNSSPLPPAQPTNPISSSSTTNPTPPTSPNKPGDLPINIVSPAPISKTAWKHTPTAVYAPLKPIPSKKPTTAPLKAPPVKETKQLKPPPNNKDKAVVQKPFSKEQAEALANMIKLLEDGRYPVREQAKFLNEVRTFEVFGPLMTSPEKTRYYNERIL